MPSRGPYVSVSKIEQFWTWVIRIVFPRPFVRTVLEKLGIVQHSPAVPSRTEYMQLLLLAFGLAATEVGIGLPRSDEIQRVL